MKEWLHQLLSPDRCIVRSPRSYNSQIGVPLSVWQLSEEAELGIFEAGISEMGEMGALKRMIKPSIGILTNIGGAHQENFFSLQEKCMEKLTLFKDCDVVIYDGDNELISNCVAKSMLTAREIAWSRTDIERPLYISRVTKKEDHTVIAYRYLNMDNTFCIPFIDDASIENVLNCWRQGRGAPGSPAACGGPHPCVQVRAQHSKRGGRTQSVRLYRWGPIRYACGMDTRLGNLLEQAGLACNSTEAP